MRDTDALNVSNLGLTNIFEIKDSINKRFEEHGLPHRLYTEVFEGLYDEEIDAQLPSYVQVYVNLKVEGYSYYRLNDFKLTSNQCQLFTEKDLMSIVMKQLGVKVNHIQQTVEVIEEIHQNILKKTLEIFSSINFFSYISTVIKS